MPKKTNIIHANVVEPNKGTIRILEQAAGSLYAYAVRKYLADCPLSTKEKKQIIKRLISELK